MCILCRQINPLYYSGVCTGACNDTNNCSGCGPGGKLTLGKILTYELYELLYSIDFYWLIIMVLWR